MRVVISIIVLVAAFVAAVFFVAFNTGATDTITVQFLGTHTVTALQLGGLCFMVGVLAVGIFLVMEEIALRLKIGRLNREIKSLRKEINALRNLPIAAEILAKDIEELEAEEKK